MAVANQNGANAHVSDPREKICWDFYVEGMATLGGNAYESAIKAGYSEDSARNITMRDWFKERLGKLRRKDMLAKAERNLDKVLDLEVEEEGKINPQLLRIKTDVSTTVAKTLGKNDGYSERSEISGPNGGPIETKGEISEEEFDSLMAGYAKRKENPGSEKVI